MKVSPLIIPDRPPLVLRGTVLYDGGVPAEGVRAGHHPGGRPGRLPQPGLLGPEGLRVVNSQEGE